MNADQFIKLLEVFVTLIQAMMWPLLVLFIIVYFGEPLRRFLNDVSKFNLKAGPTGLEANAERQAQAAALLGVATANKSDAATPQSDEEKAKQIASVVSQASRTSRTGKSLGNSLILWIDENPSRNFWERKSLESFGARFTYTRSVKDALDKLQKGKYDALIFTLTRPTDLQACYVLLEEQKRQSETIPLIVHGPLPAEAQAEVRRRGIRWQATNPLELFQTVGAAIQSE